MTEDDDLEIYGTSPGVIAWFMILISIIVPLGVIPFNAFMIFQGSYDFSNFIIYGILWSYAPNMYLTSYMIPLFILSNIWLTLPLTFLNLVYIWKIVRYFRGNCTRYSAVWVGMLSLILPSLLTFFTTLILNSNGIFALIGPIPIQFVAGLIFMYKIPGPEMTSPWKYDLGEHSWWIPKKPDWWDRRFPSHNEEPSAQNESEAS